MQKLRFPFSFVHQPRRPFVVTRDLAQQPHIRLASVSPASLVRDRCFCTCEILENLCWIIDFPAQKTRDGVRAS
jgi:hypothetical protein